jgi:hypothetical protein
MRVARNPNLQNKDNIMDTRYGLFKDTSFSKKIRMDTAKIQIVNSVDNMPGAERILAALNDLTELTNKKSVCEDYYLHSNHIAEYFCTISNFGFFAVAYYYNDYATLFAATCSALSHAIPLKRLNELDKIAAVSLFLKVMFHYDTLLHNPAIIASGLATFSLGVLDIMVGRKNKEMWGPSLHVAWHLAAAVALHQFNHAQVGEAAIPAPTL